MYKHAALREQQRAEEEHRLWEEQVELKRHTKARKRVTKQCRAERCALFKQRQADKALQRQAETETAIAQCQDKNERFFREEQAALQRPSERIVRNQVKAQTEARNHVIKQRRNNRVEDERRLRDERDALIKKGRDAQAALQRQMELITK